MADSPCSSPAKSSNTKRRDDDDDHSAMADSQCRSPGKASNTKKRGTSKNQVKSPTKFRQEINNNRQKKRKREDVLAEQISNHMEVVAKALGQSESSSHENYLSYFGNI